MRHRTLIVASLIGSTLLGLAHSVGAATISPPLASILATFVKGDDQSHISAVVSAISTSPLLTQQLNDLAASGSLKGLTLSPAAAHGFQASQENGIISLTAQFIDAQTPTGGGDATLRSEIGARDIVFVLGYMASKLRTAKVVAASDARMMADFKVMAANLPKGRAPMPQDWLSRVRRPTFRTKREPIWKAGTTRPTLQ